MQVIQENKDISLEKVMSLKEFRVYTIKELASLYYPNLTSAYASRSFHHTIKNDPILYQGLIERGYRKKKRNLSPAQVSFIMTHLGTPREFYEIQLTK